MISNEQAVIASVLLQSKVLKLAMAEAVPADFSDLRLARIYAGMVAMAAAGEPIDVLTVSDRLRSWDVRGVEAADLHSWCSEVPTAVNVGFYAERVREGAMRRGVAEIATRLVASAEADPGVALAHAVDEIRQLREGHVVQELEAKSLGEILLGEDDYDWVVEDLLERGDRLMLTGSEGGGKSTFLRQIAIMAAAGIHPFSRFPIPPAKVLVIDAENSERQWRRASRGIVAKAALRGSVNPADTMHVACMKRVDLTKDADLSEVHRLVDLHTPDILLIGPLYRLVPRSINSDDDAAPLLAALDTIRDRGLAMLIEAHAGHALGAGGDRDMRPRGSAALMGWPEFGLGLRPDKKGKSSAEFQLVRWRGDRDERKWPGYIRRGASDWPWTPTVAYR